MARFSDEQIRFIRTATLKNVILAERFGVSPTAISNIKNGLSYKAVAEEEMGRFTDDEIRAIRKSDKKPGKLAQLYGVSRITIWHIRNKITYAHVPDEDPRGELKTDLAALPGAPVYLMTSLRYGIDKKDEK